MKFNQLLQGTVWSVCVISQVPNIVCEEVARRTLIGTREIGDGPVLGPGERDSGST